MENFEVLRRDFKDRDELSQYLQVLFPDAAAIDGVLSRIRGGDYSARKLWAQFRISRYAATRNFLSGDVSQLSAYLRHGVLTLRQVADQALSQAGGFKKAYKFLQELAWRDYWQHLYFELGSGIWINREDWKTGFSDLDYADQIPADVLTQSTGLACIDSFSRTLVEDGYLHNHARMWFAAYLTHWRRVKWQAGARWFLTHLVDGDPASNNLSWQWVASTFSSEPYIFNRENLERYTNSIYCAGCSRRHYCPFNKPYAELSAELFPKATS